MVILLNSHYTWKNTRTFFDIFSLVCCLGERPYVCQVDGCEKRFTEYSSLYKHHVVHTHTKPYTCNICSKTYRQASTLAMHKRTSHGDMTAILSDGTLSFIIDNVIM